MASSIVGWGKVWENLKISDFPDFGQKSEIFGQKFSKFSIFENFDHFLAGILKMTKNWGRNRGPRPKISRF